MYRAVVTKKIASLGFVLIALFGSAVFVFATPPVSPYNPAETLNPSCAPGDTNCYVTLGSGGVTTTNGLGIIGSDVGLGGVLTQDTTITGDANTYSLDMSEFAGINLAADRDFFIRSNDRVRIVQGGNYIQVGGGQGVDLTADANKSIVLNFNATNSDLKINSSAGTAGQVLTSNGTGAAPSWTTISGWGLTGNSGTTPGTNFIGTTDAQDFVIKTNGSQIALFGQNGSISLGSEDVAEGYPLPVSSGTHSLAFGSGSEASGYGSLALGSMNPDYATIGTKALGNSSVSIGLNALAQGEASVALGNQTEALANYSFAVGNVVSAYSHSETAMGTYNTLYTPLNIGGFNIADRLFTVGNGNLVGHNAYTLWKDGSFAYNDDNFENNDPGTEQNMFYFNYGNHNGKGVVQTKQAIRLGSASDDEWDIGTANVGDRSIAIGFGDSTLAPGGNGPIASGENAMAFGYHTHASGAFSVAIGSDANASDIGAIAIGNGTASAHGAVSIGFGNGATAQGINSFASGFESFAMGDDSVAFQNGVANGDASVSFQAAPAYSAYEISFGDGPTSYVGDTTGFVATDRLFNIGNDFLNAGGSDAFTILKNGKTGIGIDNFEATANPEILQVGDSSIAGAVARFTNSTGSCIINPTASSVGCTSDERFKKNIQSLSSASTLDKVLQLQGVSYNWVRDSANTPVIGFVAQQLETVYPEFVMTDPNGYKAVAYGSLTPVLVEAIKELNVKIIDIESFSTVTNTTLKEHITAWLGDAANGITSIVTRRVQTSELCVDDICVTKDQFLRMVQASGSIPAVIPVIPADPVPAPAPDPVPTAYVPASETPAEIITPEPPVSDTPVPTPEPVTVTE